MGCSRCAAGTCAPQVIILQARVQCLSSKNPSLPPQWPFRSLSVHAAEPLSVAGGANVVGSKPVASNNGAVKVAANLYLPAHYDASAKHPAILVAHPWGGVKEQTSGLYAQQLARQGFVTLAFDASHYGQSGGEPRDLENPADRVQDIRSAVGYLSSLPQVDARCLGGMRRWRLYAQ